MIQCFLIPGLRNKEFQPLPRAPLWLRPKNATRGMNGSCWCSATRRAVCWLTLLCVRRGLGVQQRDVPVPAGAGGGGARVQGHQRAGQGDAGAAHGAAALMPVGTGLAGPQVMASPFPPFDDGRWMVQQWWPSAEGRVVHFSSQKRRSHGQACNPLEQTVREGDLESQCGTYTFVSLMQYRTMEVPRGTLVPRAQARSSTIQQTKR
jgi:hypothetical protein